MISLFYVYVDGAVSQSKRGKLIDDIIVLYARGVVK